MPTWLIRYRWVLLILAVAFVLRLFWMQNPVADWHSFRQADTASVTREYVKHGIDLLHPRYQDLSNSQSGTPNTEGWRMVEFPWVNGLTAGLILITGANEIVVGRLVSIIFSLLGIATLYGLVRRVSDEKVALVTAVVMAILPYSVYYSRAILPEAVMLGVIGTALLAYDYWLEKKTLTAYLVALMSLTLAVLLKPFVVFLAPLFVALTWYRRGWKGFLDYRIYLLAGLSFVPFIAWRKWIEQYPSGIPANEWLWNGNGIRWRPAWFRWLLWERLTLLIGGIIGALFGAINLVAWRKKEVVIYAAWWLGMVAYLSAVATGNVQHDYYQVILVPIVSISIGRGVIIVYDWLLKRFSANIAGVTVAILLIAMELIAWQHIKGFYNINHWEYVEAGQAIDRLTSPDAKIIAPAFTDTQFLFQTNRTGWALGSDIDQKIREGATHYVTTVEDDELRSLQQRFTTLEKGKRYTILDLQQPIATSSAQLK